MFTSATRHFHKLTSATKAANIEDSTYFRFAIFDSRFEGGSRRQLPGNGPRFLFWLFGIEKMGFLSFWFLGFQDFEILN